MPLHVSKFAAEPYLGQKETILGGLERQNVRLSNLLFYIRQDAARQSQIEKLCFSFAFALAFHYL